MPSFDELQRFGLCPSILCPQSAQAVCPGTSPNGERRRKRLSFRPIGFASPTGFEAVEDVEVGRISSEIEGGQDAGTPLDLARNPSISSGVRHSVSHSEPVADHRAELAQALVRALGRAIGAGDVAAARVAHRALGELMVAGDRAIPYEVVDLATKRDGRRGPPG